MDKSKRRHLKSQLQLTATCHDSFMDVKKLSYVIATVLYRAFTSIVIAHKSFIIVMTIDLMNLN